MQYLVAVPVRLIWLASFVALEMFWYAIIPIVVALFIESSSFVLAALAMSDRVSDHMRTIRAVRCDSRGHIPETASRFTVA
jgi:hypothetical protein